MKFIIPAMAIAAVLIQQPLVHGQEQRPNPPAQPDQWMSHQMHQPPPVMSDKDQLSQDRVDDIRKLYELATKELEAKIKKKASTGR